MNRRGSGLKVGLVAVAAALALPGLASGAVVERSATNLFFHAALGEANGLTVTNPSTNEYVFTDTFPIPVTDGDLGDAECIQTGFSQVTCNLTAPASFITINLHDLGDTANSSTVPVRTVMNGAAGTDTLTTGDSADIFDGGPGPDVMTGNAEADQITYFDRTAGVQVDLADAGDDGNADDGPAGARDTLTGIENVVGSNLDDDITGDGNDNEIVGLFGADNLVAGGGIDTVSYAERGPAVEVSIAGATTGNGNAAEDGIAGDSLDQFENLVGGFGNDTLTGGSAGNLIQGGGGNDTLNGGDAADLLDGGGDNDVINGEGGDDSDPGLFGFEGNDAISGGPGDDRIFGGDDADAASGGAGNDDVRGEGGSDQGTIGGLTGLDGGADNDTVRGADGDDQLIGGDGTDRVSFEDSSLGVTASLTSNTATGDGTDTLLGFENLTGTDSDDDLTGDAGPNAIDGRDDNDDIAPLAGADAITGGDGTTDVVSYAAEGATVADLTTGATNAGGTDTFVSGIEGLIGSPANDSLTGDVGDNALDGNGGNDVLAPGAGTDIADGGADSDTVSYDGSATRVVINLPDDEVNEVDAGTLDSIPNIENVIGSQNPVTDHITGDDGPNRIEGLAGDDTFFAGGGADTLIGGPGTDLMNAEGGADTLEGNAGSDQLNGGSETDTVTYANAPAGVTVNLELNGTSNDGDGGIDFQSGIDNVIGSPFGDSLTTRNGQANTMTGGGGNDFMLARSDGDTLDGGADTDTISFQFAPAAVTANLAAGTASGGEGSGDDTLAGFENLFGANTHDDTLIGNGVANQITGFTGNDTLRGAGGADTLFGGPGTDTASYSGSAGPVTASLVAPAGASNDGDGSSDTFNLIENLTGSASGDTLTGNGASEAINALAGADTVQARNAGPDVVDCGSDADTAVIDASDTSLTGCERADGPGPTGAPSITGADPASGGDQNAPRIKGTAPAGSAVSLFTSADCSGPALASGSAAEFGGVGIAIAVADNSTTTLYAQAVDGDVDGASACSAPFTYAEVTAGEAAGCTAAQEALERAQTKVKKAKKALAKARDGGDAKRIKRAKQKLKTAKQKLRKAQAAADAACSG